MGAIGALRNLEELRRLLQPQDLAELRGGTFVGIDDQEAHQRT